MTSLRVGVWLWGFALFLWLGLVLVGITCGVLDRNNPLYGVIEDNNTVVAAITAVLGVVWSWFFQLSFKARNPNLAKGM
jgi:hypothetical protein